MRVTNRRGHLLMRLDDVEVVLLQSLLDDLGVLLDEEADADDPVQQRLFPSAYPDDEAADTEFRELTENSLRSERRERIAACADELRTAPEVELSDPDVGRRWLQVLNDLRLALGTRLEITEDEPPLDPTQPREQPRIVYHWLTVVQDSLVDGLMS